MTKEKDFPEMKDIPKEAQDLITTFLEILIPDDSSQKKALAEKTKLHADTFRSLKNRNSLNADTLFRICLANGITSNNLKSVLKKKNNEISEGMLEWIRLGSKLDEKEIKLFIQLIRDLKKHYKSRK